MKELTVGVLLEMTTRQIMGLAYHQKRIKEIPSRPYELIAYKADDNRAVLEETVKLLEHLKAVLKAMETQNAVKINMYPLESGDYEVCIGTHDRKLGLQKEIDLYFPEQFAADSWNKMIKKQIKAIKAVKKCYDRVIYIPTMDD